jgi:hypothetical protein
MALLHDSHQTIVKTSDGRGHERDADADNSATRPSTDSLLDAALAYAKRGWRVIPLHGIDDGRCTCDNAECQSPGKHPRTAHGYKDGTVDDQQIRRWWHQSPDSNVGVVTGAISGLVVIDADDPAAGRVLRALADIPQTLTATTGRGLHYYLRHPGVPVAPRANVINSVDVRGDGSYVVAPPSMHVSGREYRFEDVDREPAPMSGKLLAHLTDRPATDRTVTRVTDRAGFVEGERNTSLTSVGGTFVRLGIEGADLDAVLNDVNQRLCRPPLNQGEVGLIAQSVNRYVDRMIVDETTPSRSATAKPSKAFQLLSIDQVLALETPEWLIEGLIPTASFNVHFGPSGCGKSFVALDWALSIATGNNWCGRTVRQGAAVYVVGEGTSGASRRVHAWMKHRHVASIADAFFLLEAPIVTSPADIAALLASIRERGLKPAVIVLDTLARCFIGGDENSAKDMGLFVEGCRQLQRETGATVIAIHHAGKPKNARSGPTERGSSALRAAADAVIVQKKKDHIVTVVNDKQKDDEEAHEIRLRLDRVDLGIDDKTRRPITSCVLVPMDVGMAVSADMNVCISNKSEHLALERLADLKQASSGDWHKSIREIRQKPVAERTFQHWRESLVAEGLVECIDESMHVYRCTEKGLAVAMAANGTPSLAGGDPSPASHATTPLGGGGAAEGQAVTREHRPDPPGGPEL